MSDSIEFTSRWPAHMPTSRRRAVIAAALAVPLLWATYAALARRRRRPQPPTSFAAFLKEVPTDAGAHDAGQLAATDFGSFLKKRGQSAAAAEGACQQQEQLGPPLTADSVVVTILFGTEYGFSKEIAEKLAGALRDQPPYWPRVIDMADHPRGLDLSREQALLVVCSTQGDGVPPAEAREFCDWLCADGALAAGALRGKSFSVCALGDKSYEHFCACGKMLDERLEALRAQRFVPRTDVNREDWGAVDGWLASVAVGLAALPLRPAAETGHSAGDAPGADSQAAPQWGKSRPYPGRVVAIERLCNITSQADKDTVRVEVDLGDSGIRYTPGDALGICPSNRPQDVDQLLAALRASGGEAVPRPSWPFRDADAGSGDASSTLPLRAALTSCYDIRAPKPELLQALLRALPAPQQNGEVAAARKSVQHQPEAAYGHASGHANGHANGTVHSLESGKHSSLQNGGSGAVQNGKGDSGQQPSTAASRHPAQNDKQPAQSLTAEEQAAVLQGVLKGDAEAYLAERHVADVLTDFPAARLPLTKVLAALRQLQPRLYSISSSQAEAEERVQVTVAVVHYESLGRGRVGVTSTLLAERLQVGDTLPVYVSRNPDFRLPESPATPIIMVGPGTGLAPFRAFMQERILQCGGVAAAAAAAAAAAGSPGATTDSGQPAADGSAAKQSGGSGSGTGGQQRLGAALLFFGCRRRDQDYLYGGLLQGWADAGVLELHTAFSREKAGTKVYVQDRLREAGARVWELLQGGAHFYVCGDAGGMAPAVQEALLDVIARHQGGGRAAAEEYLARLSSSGRYQRDVWLV